MPKDPTQLRQELEDAIKTLNDEIALGGRSAQSDIEMQELLRRSKNLRLDEQEKKS